MTTRQIVKSLSLTYANGVYAAGFSTDDIRNIIGKAYQQGFEDGIVFKTFRKLPNDTFTIKTDETFFTDYEEEKI